MLARNVAIRCCTGAALLRRFTSATERAPGRSTDFADGTASVAVGLAPIGEDVDHLALADGILQPFPVIGVVELPVQAGEESTLAEIGEQKAWKFLGKDVIGPTEYQGSDAISSSG